MRVAPSPFDFLISWLKFTVTGVFSLVSMQELSSEKEKKFRKYMEKSELKFNEAKYEKLVSNVKNGYGIFTNNAILYCNDQFKSTIGTKSNVQAMHSLRTIYRKPHTKVSSPL